MSQAQTLSKFRNVTCNSILFLTSFIFCFAIVELSLRLFYPKYEYAAESSFDSSMNRIWVRKPNSHYERKHPDSRQPHLVYHNNLALRQHRNFDKQDINSAINIGFFGDSFTENLRLPSQYSFTEPLDYLLNTRGSKFNVLNFGVDGYGTDQSYLYYRDFEHSEDLDYVFYIFCLNDLRNIYENNLFSIDVEQRIMQNQAHVSPWWVKIISKYHTTYLIIDFFQTIGSKTHGRINKQDIDYYSQKREHKKRSHDARADAIEQAFIHGQKTDDLDNSIAIVKSLLHLWKQAVEKNGGKFYIVLLPRQGEHNARHLFSGEFHLIDLYDKFDNEIDNYNYRDWRFTNDDHWNEASNQFAATFLYRLIENDLELSPIFTDTLKEELYTYYVSFDGWMPNDSFVEKLVVAPQKRQSIKLKYINVEIEDVNLSTLPVVSTPLGQ